jgi:hypothetical protein
LCIPTRARQGTPPHVQIPDRHRPKTARERSRKARVANKPSTLSGIQ